jgi:hypothetical protein
MSFALAVLSKSQGSPTVFLATRYFVAHLSPLLRLSGVNFTLVFSMNVDTVSSFPTPSQDSLAFNITESRRY